ncbi:MAG: hypothetical protein GY778_06235 [bacterium]|nr:hypothetical protein [bacterium]
MIKLRRHPSDVIELRQCFRIGQVIGGLAMIACGTCAFVQYGSYPPDLLPGIMVAGLAFVLAGGCILFRTNGVRIDRSAGTIRVFHGVLVFLRWSEHRFTSARFEATEDPSDPGVHDVGLQVNGELTLHLARSSPSRARLIAEKVNAVLAQSQQPSPSERNRVRLDADREYLRAVESGRRMAHTTDLTRRQLNIAMGITQEFGPTRSIPREERLRKAQPRMTDDTIHEALARCDAIERFACILGEAIRDHKLSVEAAQAEMAREYPELGEHVRNRAVSQATYFASK